VSHGASSRVGPMPKSLRCATCLSVGMHTEISFLLHERQYCAEQPWPNGHKTARTEAHERTLMCHTNRDESTSCAHNFLSSPNNDKHELHRTSFYLTLVR